jgi:hypothetical protein
MQAISTRMQCFEKAASAAALESRNTRLINIAGPTCQDRWKRTGTESTKFINLSAQLNIKMEMIDEKSLAIKRT